MKFRGIVARYFKDLGIPVKAEGYQWILNDTGSISATSRVVASYDPNQRRVFLNQRHPFWIDPDTMMSFAFSQRLISTADRMHPAYQEHAHFLHHAILGDDRYLSSGAAVLEESQANLAVSEVSRYAAKSPNEFVAEVFAGLKVRKHYNLEVMALYLAFERPKP